MNLRIIDLQGKMNREKQHEGKVSLESLFQIKSLKIFFMALTKLLFQYNCMNVNTIKNRVDHPFALGRYF